MTASAAGTLLAVQPAPPSWALGVSLALAVVAVLRPAWPWTRHVVTIAHEGVHGLAALATGRRLAGIRLHDDSSGLTVSVGPRSGPGMVAVLVLGYPGPALLGLLGAWVLSSGRVAALLWGLLLALALLLVQIRNWFGLLPVLVTGAVVALVTLTGPLVLQQVFAQSLVLFLLLGAVRAVVELQGSRLARGRGGDSDADQLARLTHLPGTVWVVLLLLATVACLAVGGTLLAP